MKTIWIEKIAKLLGAKEQEDLAYMNEVDAALIRKPLIGPVFLSFGTIFFIAIFTLWAANAYVDEVAKASGQVVSSQRTQLIENLEGGILDEVLVSEGQVVQKGDLLARLRNEQAKSAYQEALGKSLEQRVAIARLEAILNNQEPIFAEDLVSQVPEIIQDQRNLFYNYQKQKNAELQVLEAESQQKEAEMSALENKLTQLHQSLALKNEKASNLANLVAQELYSRNDYNNLKQEIVEVKGEIERIQENIKGSKAALEEVKQRSELRKSELNSQVAEEINKRRTELSALEENISAGSDRVARTELKSPVHGIVKSIAVNTVGGVVAPGMTIMQIVPIDEILVIEAKLKPSDVAFIRPKQEAMIKFSAYDFSIYGGMEGYIEQISADTIEDKRGDYYYLVKILTKEPSLKYKDQDLAIMPGMIVTVDILTGKKSILSYLLKPIIKTQENAFQER